MLYLIKKLLWYCQSIFLRICVKPKLVSDVVVPLNTVIVVAHADDELIGCYQLLKRFHDRITIIYCGMTGTKTDINNFQVRFSEIKEVAEELGVNLIYVKALFEIEKYLIENRPLQLYIPSSIDWHHEHRYLSIIIKEVFEKNQFIMQNLEIYCYQETVPLPEIMISHGIRMNKKSLDHKWKYIRDKYPSQKNLPWDRFKYNERINGKISRSAGLEVYAHIKPNEWLELINRLKSQEESLNDLSKHLNNLIKLRKKVKAIAEDLWGKEIG